jgi:hypothetical protein
MHPVLSAIAHLNCRLHLPESGFFVASRARSLGRVSRHLNGSGHPQERRGGKDEYGTPQVNSERAASRGSSRAKKQTHSATTKGGAEKTERNTRKESRTRTEGQILAAILDLLVFLFLFCFEIKLCFALVQRRFRGCFLARCKWTKNLCCKLLPTEISR